MDSIKKSALRSAEMVKQLLSLARTTETAFLVTDLRTIIRSAEKLGYHSLDKTVCIAVSLPAEPALIFADPIQIEQVLLNFFINAAHAMTVMRPVDEAQGGTITVGLSQFEADSHFVSSHPHAKPIPYWCVSIRDSGIGMDSETQAHLFEPFFSNKPKGLGTGLGLTMAYNIFQRHQGFITVYSEKGNGTEFRLYLPVAPGDQPRDGVVAPHAIKQGTGLVLIIDDETVLLNTASRMLELCGYTVMRAQTGEEGIALYQQHYRQVVLVLLDLSLPALSGKDIYPRLKAISPSVKVLLASGYKEDIRVTQLLDQGVQKFITKPYSLATLAGAVDEVLKPA
jgi:CheY-like chemotaxis protein